jgi:hypothetical protein
MEAEVKAVAVAGLTIVLAGCGSNAVSPEIASKSDVTTEAGDHGYPVITSIKFSRPAIDKQRLEMCLTRNVDQPEGPLSSDERTSQPSGRVLYVVPQGMIPATNGHYF